MRHIISSDSNILENVDSLIFSHQSDKVLNSPFIHENITLVGLAASVIMRGIGVAKHG